MQTIIQARVTGGLDSFLRVVTVLRQKTFDISEVEMINEPEFANVRIVLNDHKDRSAEMAKAYMKRLYQVHQVEIKTLSNPSLNTYEEGSK